MNGQTRSSPTPTAVWVILGLAGIILLVLIISAFTRDTNLGQTGQNDQQVLGLQDDEQIDDQSRQILAGLAENPDAYLGRDIEVSSQVESVINQNSFTLEGPGLPPDFDVLVLSAQATDLTDGDVVRVRGTVRRLDINNIQEIERQLGVDLDEFRLSTFNGQVVVIADTVEKVGQE